MDIIYKMLGENLRGSFMITKLVWENTTINKIMVDEHYAVLYNGQSKEDIEEQHLENRKRLIEAGKI